MTMPALPWPDLVSLLRQRAFAAPDRVATTFLTDGERVGGERTWAALDRRARAVATALQRQGETDDRVLIVLDEGLEALDALFGCLFARRLAVPVHPPDPARLARTLPRLRAVAADADPSVVLTSSALVAQLREVPELARAEILAVAALEDDDGWVDPGVRPDDLAYLQYTSGSTAHPKGVMVSHRNLAHQLADFDDGLRHDEGCTMVSWLPSTHDLGLVYGRLLPLWKGMRSVFFPAPAFVARPQRWMEAMSTWGGTHSPAPCFAFELAARRVTPEEVARLDLSRVRVLLDGAEPIRRDSEEAFARAYATAGLPPTAITHAMGMSEATAKIVREPADGRVARFVDLDRAAYERRRVVRVPAGTPGALVVAGNGSPSHDTRVAIVDPDDRRVLPEDEVGELWVAGTTVARGYWNAPEATEATFRARTSDGDGPWLRTGDLAFLHGGELYLSGRLKDLVILRGDNHHAQDLEWAVERAHPDLRSGCSAAFGVVGDAGEELVVVAEVLPEAVPDAVFAAMRQALSELGVAARTLALIPPRTLPKTSSGKLRRADTRSAFVLGELPVVARWDAAAPVEQRASVGLRERVLAAPPRRRVDLLLDEVLRAAAQRCGMAPDEIDPDRTFGELGLDSVSAVELVTSTGRALGLDLPETLLFDHPTPEALAAELLRRL